MTTESERAPDAFRRDCAALGFDIIGWDDTTAGLVGNGAEYVGTHAEVMAFLRGWVTHQDVAPREVARYVLSMSARNLLIPPGQSFTITSRPQRSAFQGERLAIPDAIAHHYTIDDVSVGNRSAFIQAGSIDGSMFAARIDKLPEFKFDGPHRVIMTRESAETIGTAIALDLAQTAMDIVIYATLKDDAPLGTEFSAAIFGTYPMAPSTNSQMISHNARRAAFDIAGRALARALGEIGGSHPFNTSEFMGQTDAAALVRQWETHLQQLDQGAQNDE